MENHITKDQNDTYPCEQISPIFLSLSAEELNILNKTKIIIHFKAGEIIQKQGTAMSHIIFIISGLVKVYFEGEDQSNTILRIVKPGNFVGGPGIYSDHFYHFTVSAMKDTYVGYFDFTLFKNLLDQNKAFAAEFLKEFSISILAVYSRLMALNHKKTAGKMAYTLLYLFDEIYEKREHTISISTHDLADLASVSRDSTLKILRDFQHDGIIRLIDHLIEIVKPEKLRLIESVG